LKYTARTIVPTRATRAHLDALGAQGSERGARSIIIVLQGYSQPFGEPVDEVEIGNDFYQAKNFAVGQTGRAQVIDVAFAQ